MVDGMGEQYYMFKRDNRDNLLELWNSCNQGWHDLLSIDVLFVYSMKIIVQLSQFDVSL